MAFTHGVTSSVLDTKVRSVGAIDNPIAYIGTAKISGKTEGQFAASAGKWEYLQTRSQALAFLGTDSASTQLEMALSARATNYTIPGFLGEFHDNKQLNKILVWNAAAFTTVTDESVTGSSGAYTLTYGYVKDLTVTDTAASTTYLEGRDYTFDHKTGIISAVEGGTMTATATVLVDYKYADSDVSNVAEDEIKAAMDARDDIFQNHSVIPSMFIAPTFENLTSDTTYKVISALKTSSSLNDGRYASRAIVGINGTSTSDIKDTILSAIGTTGSDLDYVGHFAFGAQALTGSELYALEWVANSVNTAGIIGVDPASNEEVNASLPTAPFNDTDGNVLNQEGINTFVAYRGLRTWGNYTSQYSEPGEFLDNFSSIRFILNFVKNNINDYARNYSVDEETNTPRIEYHVATMNRNFIKRLIRAGALLEGSEVTFNAEDNPVEDLLAGKYTFSIGLGFIPPATTIATEYWYNTDLIVNLFSGE